MTETDRHETPLESWREIATYLPRDPKTVRRWERHEALPVRRHRHRSRSTVYAYPSELDAWRANREPTTEPTRSRWLRPVPSFASKIALAMPLMMAGRGPQVGAVAQAADGIVTRQVWTAVGIDPGAVSRDGRYLAYVNWSDAIGELAVYELVTGSAET